MKLVVMTILMIGFACGYLPVYSQSQRHRDKTIDEHERDEHDEHDEHKHDGSFGKNKAIQAVDEHGYRFKLSQAAISRLGIASKVVEARQNGSYFLLTVSEKSLVFSRNDIGLYGRQGQWFQFLAVELISSQDKHYQIRLKGLEPGYELVTEGVALLRVAQLEAMGKGGKGHVH